MNYYAPLARSIVALQGLVGESHVRAGNATYRDPDNSDVVTTLGTNLPRFESVGGYRALLIEPADTDIGKNLIQYSHELDNGWWQRLGLTTVSANGMLAPDGNTVADGLVADATENDHVIYSPLLTGIAQNDKVAATIYAKPGDQDWVKLDVRFFTVADAGLTRGSYYFDVSSGTIGTKTEEIDITIHDYKIEEAANGFYRIGIIISSADATTSKVRLNIFSAEADNDDAFAGDASTANTWLWGEDVKNQDFFDSHVPTSGATASRATESGYPLYTLPAGLFDSAGTAIIRVRFGFAKAGVTSGYGIVATKNGADSIIYVSTAKGYDIASSDVTTVIEKDFAYAANIWYKIALKWGYGGKFRIGIDSGSGISWGTEDNFDGSFQLGTNLRLGFALFGPMWLRELMLLDRVLSDDEINASENLFKQQFHHEMYRR